ncbi:MAG TPA: GNAT family N-acetyltransferase [Burkholderiaceae bacterium]|nr:GNAT family N-acetyltransferase [Burkholderiaceae bacterium]
MNFEIPTVETERLVLRAFREADLDAFAAMSADPDVMRHIGDGRAVDRNATWRTLAGFNGHWSLRRFGMWAIERRSDGAFIGRVGLHHPPYWPALEAGWVLARAAWGQGFAREGAAAVLAFARRRLPPQRLVSFIRPGNERSVKVALALGAAFEGVSDLLGTPVEVYVHERGAAG